MKFRINFMKLIYEIQHTSVHLILVLDHSCCFAPDWCTLLPVLIKYQGWPENPLPSHLQLSLEECCVISEVPLEGLVKKHFLGTSFSQTYKWVSSLLGRIRRIHLSSLSQEVFWNHDHTSMLIWENCQKLLKIFSYHSWEGEGVPS